MNELVFTLQMAQTQKCPRLDYNSDNIVSDYGY